MEKPVNIKSMEDVFKFMNDNIQKFEDIENIIHSSTCKKCGDLKERCKCYPEWHKEYKNDHMDPKYY